MSRRLLAFLAAEFMLLCAAIPAQAQVIGTFSWQTAPYCNVVTVEVVQQGPLYQLVGSDNLCGAGSAPVTGTALPGGPGVVFGMTIALPSGQAAHLSATASIATASGTWSDGEGHSGTFAFNGPGTGSPRPAPSSAAAITVNQLSPTVYGGTGSAVTVARSDHEHDSRYYPRADVDTLLADKANVGEVLSAGSMSSWSFVPEAFGRVFPVTTTRAGRLEVHMGAWVVPTCSPNAAGSRAIFLVVDGVLIPSSWVFTGTAATAFSGVLSGVTTAVVPAGTHQIGYALECFGSDTANYSSIMGNATVSVVVLR